MKLPETEPAAYGSLTKEQFDKEIEKGIKEILIYEEEPWHGQGLRVLTVDNYIVFYLPDKINSVISIVRIMYSGRDISKQLNDN